MEQFYYCKYEEEDNLNQIGSEMDWIGEELLAVEEIVFIDQLSKVEW